MKYEKEIEIPKEIQQDYIDDKTYYEALQIAIELLECMM